MVHYFFPLGRFQRSLDIRKEREVPTPGGNNFHIEKIKCRTRGLVENYSACLACTRPKVRSPTP
jgi:hypothetical protein